MNLVAVAALACRQVKIEGEQVETGLDVRHPAGAVVTIEGEQIALR